MRTDAQTQSLTVSHASDMRFSQLKPRRLMMAIKVDDRLPSGTLNEFIEVERSRARGRDLVFVGKRRFRDGSLEQRSED